MQFLRFKPIYRATKTGKDSVNFIDVLPHRLTIDQRYVPRWLFSNCRTVFEEASIIPPEEVIRPAEKDLFRTKSGTSKETERQLIQKIKTLIEEIVLEMWSPDMFHVHLHSSGFDSRILSWTIRNLYKKYGRSWLGDVMFLSSKWEGVGFKEIIEHEGWSKGQYHVVDEQLKDDEYFASTFLNFKGIWRETNGPSVKLNNVMWYLVDRAQKKGIIPEHIQLWSSQWGDTVLGGGAYPGPSSPGNSAAMTKEMWSKHYLSVIGQCSHKCDELVEPFASLELAKLLISSTIHLGMRMRPRFLATFDERLAKFVRIPRGNRRGPIADWILGEMLDYYQSSWYGQRFPIAIFPKLNKTHRKWAQYSAASMCEWLIANGYSLRCPK